MKIEFTEDCANGIKKGEIRIVSDNVGNAIIAKRRAKEVKTSKLRKKKTEEVKD